MYHRRAWGRIYDDGLPVGDKDVDQLKMGVEHRDFQYRMTIGASEGIFRNFLKNEHYPEEMKENLTHDFEKHLSKKLEEAKASKEKALERLEAMKNDLRMGRI